MSETIVNKATDENIVVALVRRALDMADSIPHAIIALLARFGVGGVFLYSGLNKVTNCDFPFLDCKITSSTYNLFKTQWQVPLLPYEVSAVLATIGEHVFPFLLFIGLASRFAAGGLFVMTLVIQIFVYPDAWPTHTVWAAALLYIIARGPGFFSLDHFVRKKVLGD